MRVIASRELPVQSEDDVIEVRRTVQRLAKERGFNSFGTAAITTATSELARNAWVHGGGGSCRIEEVEERGRLGLRLAFVDRGPGIGDLELAMRGGYSTRRSLGMGLPGSRRLVDVFDIRTAPGAGTTVTVLKWSSTGGSG